MRLLLHHVETLRAFDMTLARLKLWSVRHG